MPASPQCGDLLPLPAYVFAYYLCPGHCLRLRLGPLAPASTEEDETAQGHHYTGARASHAAPARRLYKVRGGRWSSKMLLLAGDGRKQSVVAVGGGDRTRSGPTGGVRGEPPPLELL